MELRRLLGAVRIFQERYWFDVERALDESGDFAARETARRIGRDLDELSGGARGRAPAFERHASVLSTPGLPATAFEKDKNDLLRRFAFLAHEILTAIGEDGSPARAFLEDALSRFRVAHLRRRASAKREASTGALRGRVAPKE